jgi:hypothetical protein
MAAPDTLTSIVRAGCDLTLTSPVAPDLLRSLARAAQASGVRLTVTTQIAPVLVAELVQYGKTVAFIDGLLDYQKK